MRRQPRSVAPSEWHPALRAVIESAAGECPRGHAEALRALMTLAIRKAPARGIFDPTVRDEEDLFAAIESVARAHLELTDAKGAWRKALQAVPMGVEQRDDIERAALQVQTTSETAYFYAGLAFGLAYAYVGRAA